MPPMSTGPPLEGQRFILFLTSLIVGAMGLEASFLQLLRREFRANCKGK